MIQPGNDQRPRAHFEQRSGALELHAAVHAGGGNEQAIAVGVQSGLQRFQERREDRVIDGGNHCADRVGAARVERARERVGREFEFGEDPQHVLAGLRRDRWRVVQDPRCGGDRDPGLARNIPQGDPSRRLLAPQWSAFGHSDSGARYAAGAIRAFALGLCRALHGPACNEPGCATHASAVYPKVSKFSRPATSRSSMRRRTESGGRRGPLTLRWRASARHRSSWRRTCCNSPWNLESCFPVTGHNCYSRHM